MAAESRGASVHAHDSSEESRQGKVCFEMPRVSFICEQPNRVPKTIAGVTSPRGAHFQELEGRGGGDCPASLGVR